MKKYRAFEACSPEEAEQRLTEATAQGWSVLDISTYRRDGKDRLFIMIEC